jgi:hypothetical protein
VQQIIVYSRESGIVMSYIHVHYVLNLFTNNNTQLGNT